MFDAVSALGAEMVSHEGSFLEATDAQFEAAVPSELGGVYGRFGGSALVAQVGLVSFGPGRASGHYDPGEAHLLFS